MEMRKGNLVGLVLDRLNELMKDASNGVTEEAIRQKEVLKAETPLCDISVAITDAQRWIRALLNELP